MQDNSFARLRRESVAVYASTYAGPLTVPSWTVTGALAVGGNTTLTGTLAVTGASAFTGAVTMASTLVVTGATTLSAALSGTTGTFSSTLGVTGVLSANTIGVLTGTTATVYNTTATTVDAFGAATALNLGSSVFSMNCPAANWKFINTRNSAAPSIDFEFTGALVTDPLVRFFRNSTTGMSSATFLGYNPGTSTLRWSIDSVTGNAQYGDLTLTGGDIIASTATTWNVLNTVATTVNAFGAATTINTGTSGTTFQVGSTSGSSQTNVQITSAAGTNRCFRFLTGASRRWEFRCDSTAESGANTGSTWGIVAYDDANTFIDAPLQISRAAGGNISIARPIVGATTQSVFNTTSTTVNAFGAATAINMGASAATLLMSDDTDAVAVFGRCRLASATTDRAQFCHRDRSGSSQYALSHFAGGDLQVNGASSIAFQINASTEMTLSATDLTFSDAFNFIFNATTGTKLATATTQKMGFWNATPIVQPSSTGEATGFTAGAGTPVLDGSTFTGNVGSTAYRINDIVKHLKNAGLIAA